MSGAILQLATSRGLVIAISLVTAPILGRLFPPQAYGAFNILSTLVSILGVFATLSYASALPLAASPSERRDLFVLSSMIGVITTSIVALGAYLGADQLAAIYHDPQLGEYAMFLPLLFLFGGIRQLLDVTLTCQRRFAAVAGRGVVEMVATRFMQLGICPLVGLLGSSLGLLLSGLAGSCTSALVAGLASVRGVLRTAETPLRTADLLAAAWKHRQFPLVACWSMILNAVTVALPAMVLGMHFSVSVVGLYGMAYMLVNMPLNLFSASTGQVLYVEAAQRVVQGQSAASTVQHMMQILAALISFPLAVVLILGPLLFEVFLGSQWREAGVYAQILFPWMALMAFSSPLSTAFAVFARQGEGFLWNIALLVARASALYFGAMFLGIRETLGLFVTASAMIVAWLLFRLLRLLGVGPSWAITMIARSYVPPILLLAPAGVLYWCFGQRMAVLAALAIACAMYLLLLHFWHPHILKGLTARVMPSRPQPTVIP